MSDHCAIYYLSTKQPIGLIVMLTTAGFWRIKSGRHYCQILQGGRCVTDGSGNYGNNEYCEVEALKTLKMTTSRYYVADNNDYVTVRGIQYRKYGSGRKNQGPNQVTIAAGDTWTWQSDEYGTSTGFTICGRWLCENIFAYMHAYIYTYIHTGTYVHTHKRIQTHIHTHTYRYRLRNRLRIRLRFACMYA